jgi:DNA ligase-1
MKLQKLLKLRSDGGLQQWEMEVVGCQYRVTSGAVGAQLHTNDWTTAAAKNVGRANETSPEQQAKLEAQAVWDKKYAGGYRATEAELKTVTLFKPMLAHKLKDYPVISFPVYVQPKLDGVRCLAKPDGLFTREGNPHRNMAHVAADIAKVLAANPKLVVDGEGYADKLCNDFNQIIHLIRQPDPTHQDIHDSEKLIRYHVYDGCFKDHPEYTFACRIQILQDLLTNCPTVQLVPTFLVHSQAELDAKYAEFLEAGYEGIMIRTDTPYENKRTKALIKRKEFIDAEFIVADITEGSGNRAGTAGRVILEKHGKAGIRGNKAFFTRLLQERQSIIGKKVTVRFQGYTPDNKLRFPVVVAVRDYE